MSAWVDKAEGNRAVNTYRSTQGSQQEVYRRQLGFQEAVANTCIGSEVRHWKQETQVRRLWQWGQLSLSGSPNRMLWEESAQRNNSLCLVLCWG